MKSLLLVSSLSLVLGCRTVDAVARPAATAERDVLSFDAETYTLPNGMRVTLHEDHSLPKVVVNTWFAVGSRDEERGRTGFAHLFEHLMFMGTERVPGNQFDVLMEQGGGSNNASTSSDRTNYYSMGPSALLPTLLWLDADRLDALPAAMTTEKLDRQRAVVRNERRQSYENVPYGVAGVLLPEAMYPVGHPYHHPVIGSHADLEAATLEDVLAFFETHYVPANASLVVAGDFDPQAVRALVARTFGTIPPKPVAARGVAPRWDELAFDGERRVVATDDVQFPMLTLAWHSPAYKRPGDGELDLAGAILAGGPSSRLYGRLVEELELAQSVDAYQVSSALSSEFRVEAIAAPGASLDDIERVVLEELDAFATAGPTADELRRAKVQQEAGFLRRMESLFARADAMNEYLAYFGVADGFQRDLDRWLTPTTDDVRIWAARVFGAGRLDLRVLPAGTELADGSLDERPENLATPPFTPPVAQTFELSNGVEVHVLERPGAQLFAGALVVDGGDRLVPTSAAGLATLATTMLEAGAGGLDKAAFADAVESLGASLSARAGTYATTVSVNGLTSRLDETLDRFADLVRRPLLDPEAFELERSLQLAGIDARADNPRAVASLVGDRLLFGADDPRGRPGAGTRASVERLAPVDVEAALGGLLSPARATFVFAGDLGATGAPGLVSALERRFGDWTDAADPDVPALAPLVDAAPGRIVVVDRPGAPQTMVRILRPLPALEGVERMARRAADTVFGGTFTSRLNSNLREDKGYTYGASSRVQELGDDVVLVAGSAVRTDVTGASLVEFKREFDRMHAEGIDAAELGKALESLRRGVVEQGETTSRLARTLAGLVADGRPLDQARRDLAALEEVTLEGVNRIATGGTYDWDELLVVLVGDREEVLSQLAEAGFEGARVEPAE